MISNHYTMAHQLVKDGSINVGLVVRWGWGGPSAFLGLVRAEVSKDGPVGILQGQGRL